MMKHIYKMTYDLNPVAGNFTAAEIKESGLGGTDAIIMCSLLYPEDGSFSCQIMSFDGRNKCAALADIELFKVWTLMAHRLAESETIGEGRKEFAKMVFEMHRKMMGH